MRRNLLHQTSSVVRTTSVVYPAHLATPVPVTQLPTLPLIPVTLARALW